MLKELKKRHCQLSCVKKGLGILKISRLIENKQNEINKCQTG